MNAFLKLYRIGGDVNSVAIFVPSDNTVDVIVVGHFLVAPVFVCSAFFECFCNARGCFKVQVGYAHANLNVSSAKDINLLIPFYAVRTKAIISLVEVILDRFAAFAAFRCRSDWCRSTQCTGYRGGASSLYKLSSVNFEFF